MMIFAFILIGIILIFAFLAAAGVTFARRAPQGFLLGITLLITGMLVGDSIPLLMSMPMKLDGIGQRYAGTVGGCMLMFGSGGFFLPKL